MLGAVPTLLSCATSLLTLLPVLITAGLSLHLTAPGYVAHPHAHHLPATSKAPTRG